MIQTERLLLRAWRDDDAEPFAALNADPEVMHDYPAPLTRAESDTKLARYRTSYEDHGFSRWVVERKADGAFVGYVGMMRANPGWPLPSAIEIGWRLIRPAWGFGYATEAARAAIADGFERLGFDEILACTSAVNLRSQAVMMRVGMTRDPSRDFDYPQASPGRPESRAWAYYITP